MLVIRLARGGRHKYPTYRIVAAESARAATGKFVEILGHYNPHTKELVIKKDETVARLNHGAQPSNTVIKLLQREKIELPKWVELKTKVPKPKEAPQEEPKTEAKAEEPTDVTPDEAAADAAETTDAPKEKTEEPPADSEPRVATAATENAAENEDKVPDPDSTETTEITEKAAEAAVKTEAAGVETPASEPDKASK
jgi:small subunit ribosomal protein S16